MKNTNAAFGAYEIIKNSANINLGIGTGSTTMHLLKTI